MARKRLPEAALASMAGTVGRNVFLDAPSCWSWRGRDVKIVDGSTLSMPDTPANQAIYPQSSAQKPGLGFPIMRVVVIFSLSVGTVLEAAFNPYLGKETGETGLKLAHEKRPHILLLDLMRCLLDEQPRHVLQHHRLQRQAAGQLTQLDERATAQTIHGFERLP